jgi:hypothetical protein
MSTDSHDISYVGVSDFTFGLPSKLGRNTSGTIDPVSTINTIHIEFNIGGVVVVVLSRGGGAHNAIRMMFGADNQFYSFSRIADGSASAADDIMQADNISGGTGLVPWTWYSATTTA